MSNSYHKSRILNNVPPVDITTAKMHSATIKMAEAALRVLELTNDSGDGILMVSQLQEKDSHDEAESSFSLVTRVVVVHDDDLDCYIEKMTMAFEDYQREGVRAHTPAEQNDAP